MLSRRRKPDDGKYLLIGGSDKTIDSSWEFARTNDRNKNLNSKSRINPPSPQDEYTVIIQTT